MRPVAWIQKVDGEFSNINFLTAYIGLKKFNGFHVNFFESVDEVLPTLDKSNAKDTVVYGGIPVMDKVFAKLGVSPNVPYWPTELSEFMGRKTWDSTVAQVRNDVEAGNEFFCKPAYAHKKAFNGRPMKKFLDLLPMHHMQPTDQVQCSELVNFVSEYRFFAHKKLGLLGGKHYAGDFKKVVDFEVAERCRTAFVSSPIAYSIDLGLTDDGRTLLVECNDALSLGCYGLDPSMFSIMILDRWKEIIGESS